MGIDDSASHVFRLNGTLFRLPSVPVGWLYLCSSDELRLGPVAIELGPRTYVGFRDETGRVAVIDGRCSLLGAKLACGEVVGGRVRCPLHGWEYGATGICEHIPASTSIPPFARQQAYPAVEIGRSILFSNSPTAPFPFPFYDDVQPADLLPSRPFRFHVNTPWYMISANAFDLQHFRMAHDRTLTGQPTVEQVAPFGRRISAEFDVTGTSIRDALTRTFSGPRVRMTITSWGGTVILVTAAFRRTTTYGMVFVRPAGERGPEVSASSATERPIDV